MTFNCTHIGVSSLRHSVGLLQLVFTCYIHCGWFMFVIVLRSSNMCKNKQIPVQRLWHAAHILWWWNSFRELVTHVYTENCLNVKSSAEVCGIFKFLVRSKPQFCRETCGHKPRVWWFIKHDLSALLLNTRNTVSFSASLLLSEINMFISCSYKYHFRWS